MPGRRLPGHAPLAVALGLSLLAALTSCGPAGPAPGAGDPGGHRLAQLGEDRVFAALPAGAVPSRPLVKTPARYRAPAFQAAGWDGPSVSLTFTSSQPLSSVYSFFAARAAAAGWHPANRNALGYPQTWSKTYPDGVRGSLSLIPLGQAREDGSRSYVLTASSPSAVTP